MKGREPFLYIIGELANGHEPLVAICMYMYFDRWYFRELTKAYAYPVGL